MEKLYKVQMNSKGMPNFSTAVEVADRPQGKWVFVESKISDRKLKKCSVCGLGYVSLKPDNYCPHCGARMKGADGES